MKLRCYFLLLPALVCVVVTGAAGRVHAQNGGQGVGLTVEGPPSVAPEEPAAPTEAPTTVSGGGTTNPSGSSDGGTTIHGTSVTNTSQGGAGSDRPLPRTGADILRLVALALGLITAGDVLIRMARMRHRSPA